MASPTPTRIRLNHLNLPQRLTTRRCRGTRSARRPQEHMLLLLVLVHGQELLLLGVEQTHYVTALQDFVLILFVLHEQRDLPRCRRIENVHLFAARIVGQLVVGRHVQILQIRIDRIENDFIADHHIVAGRSELVEGHDVEPGALVTVGVQIDAHRVLLEQRWQALVDRNVFVGFKMEQLDHTAVLGGVAQQLFVFRLVLFLFDFSRVL